MEAGTCDWNLRVKAAEDGIFVDVESRPSSLSFGSNGITSFH